MEPNPVARAQLVNAYLQLNNISPSATVISSFLTSAVSLQHRQDLSFALLGARNTVTFIATRSDNTRVDTISTGRDDLSTSSQVLQQGFSVNYAHRLTPDYALGVLVSQQNTTGVLSAQDAVVQLFSISLTGRVSRRAFMSLGARHVVSTSSSVPYSENAITANLTLQF
jgi:uncharacterized protein (PEP-CTERM system associated)